MHMHPGTWGLSSFQITHHVKLHIIVSVRSAFAQRKIYLFFPYNCPMLSKTCLHVQAESNLVFILLCKHIEVIRHVWQSNPWPSSWSSLSSYAFTLYVRTISFHSVQSSLLACLYYVLLCPVPLCKTWMLLRILNTMHGLQLLVILNKYTFTQFPDNKMPTIFHQLEYEEVRTVL